MNQAYMINSLPIREKPDRVCAWCGKSDGKATREETPKGGTALWKFVCACGSTTYSRTETKPNPYTEKR